MLYIAGAPRYNHTGRVIIYRLNGKDNIVVSQTLRGEQVRPLQSGVWQTVILSANMVHAVVLVEKIR